MWETQIYIYDRTQEDVEYAREHRGDSNYYKGAFNNVDLNRIVDNMLEIAQYLKIYMPVKNDWKSVEELTESESIYNAIPTETEIQKILDLLEALRKDVYGIHREIPKQPIYHYEKINQIEKLIYDIKERILNVAKQKTRLATFELGGMLI